ncbi:MAG: tryptophan--tRNA ligase [Candidatus Kuenenbacteria bacterium]
MEQTKPQKIFSGIQPTGELHIGNYLGAIKQFVELQNQIDSIFSIVDYHSLTENFDPEIKQEQIINTAIDYLACGIDPEKSILFVQSHVTGHTELAWILNCITPVAELQRMTQYKDKSKSQKDNINMGLFDYPVLMAADILLYKADLVPVGEDQTQHVELTRKIAKKFNNKFGDTFPEPQTRLNKTARVMSLTDPAKKMSKSHGAKSYITLSDPPDVIKEKISKAVTDSGSAKNSKTNGGKNLLDLFAVFINDESITNKFEDDYKNGELQYSKLKPMLANVIIQSLKPIQEKRSALIKNPDYIRQILAQGKEKAQKIATATMQEVKQKIGLI